MISDDKYNFSEGTATPTKSDPRTRVFVGDVYGTMNARGLATVMNDKFGSVESAVIDTDTYQCPIGEFTAHFINCRTDPNSFNTIKVCPRAKVN